MLDLNSLQFKITGILFVVLLLLAVVNEVSRASLPNFLGTLVSIAATLGAFFFMFWYVRRQTKPLEELTATARQISAGDLKVRAPTRIKNEIGAVASAFNEMADRLVQQIRTLEEENRIKSEFISIATHNLQTPLVVMKGYIDTLREQPAGFSREQQQILAQLDQTAASISKLNRRLLTTIELQGELVSLNKQKKDLASVASRVVKEFGERARQKEIDLRFKVAREPLVAEFDPEWLKIVWENLLDNAIKYTPRGGRVTVRVGKREDGRIFGEVEDTGIGIPKAERNKVLMPFHRAQDVMRADYEGVGLGLYIVKLVIDKHDGKIEIDSQRGKGTKIRFLLPAETAGGRGGR